MDYDLSGNSWVSFGFNKLLFNFSASSTLYMYVYNENTIHFNVDITRRLDNNHLQVPKTEGKESSLIIQRLKMCLILRKTSLSLKVTVIMMMMTITMDRYRQHI